MSWNPPSLIDEYRLIRLIGFGGMGQVYLAEDTLLERPVAVKFVASVRPDEHARQRFRMEARAIARLSHPNVMAVHRVGEVDGRPYLVAEFLRGRTLDQLDLPVPWERALQLGLGIARGLAAAHRQGVLHRDIKPANVMLTDGEEVKLLDFGLAKLLTEAAPEQPPRASTASAMGAKELTHSDGMLGTPLYLAPEVLRGEPATRRSDVYSVGAVLYELCAGVAPRETADRDLPFEDWVDAPTVAVEERAAGIDPRFAALIARCLARSPEDRFASAEELCTALVELGPEHAPGEIPEGNPYRGLQAFEAEHRALFFGRSAESLAVLERLRAEPLVVVVGDSGVGKSSLCRAGVLPRIAEGGLGKGRTARILTLVPGRRPLAALTWAVAATSGQDEGALTERVRGDPVELGRELRRSQSPGTGTVVFIDQLEELFTLAVAEEVEPFARAIAHLSAVAGGVRVLMTVRGDFFARLGALPALGEEISRALFLLRPLSPEAMGETITGPARRKGVRFESQAMVDSLVQSASHGAGGLALLQFAMAELWETRDKTRNLIPGSALEAIGNVRGVLARHADRLLASLLPEERQNVRRILLRLVTPDGTRARLTAADLDTNEPSARAALEALIRGRLLVARAVEGETAYEVAHEALLQGWDTLRRWLDADVEKREVRERVESAAAEWGRLGRAREALWSARQLAEAVKLDRDDVSAQAAGFLDASRASVRRARLTRTALLVAAPLAIGLALGGMRLKARWDLDQLVASYEGRSAQEMADGRQARAQAHALRTQALALFDAGEDDAVEKAHTRRQDAERIWTTVLDATRRADAAFARAGQALEAALALDPSEARLRSLIADALAERIFLAEESHDRERQEELLQRLALHDDGRWQRVFAAPPRLAIETHPPGARVDLERYEQAAGRRKRVPLRTLGTTPLGEVPLPEGPGSYRLTFTAPGRASVFYPVLLARAEALRVNVNLPDARSVPEGFIYVPPGRFLVGSSEPDAMRQGLLNAAPLHEARTGAFLISRTEVTFREWIRFLEDLSLSEQARRIPAADHRQWSLKLRRLPGGTWQLTFEVNGERQEAREGEPLRWSGRDRRAVQDWRELPVSAISLGDAEAYLAWLNRTGSVPRARLCHEQEWERAARGADDRRFPHGDRLEPEDAAFDETYGRRKGAFGPDEVGSHPASISPFGLLDATGNVYEWTRSGEAQSEAIIRGGSWYYDSISDLSANRTVVEPQTRDIGTGLRVCADAPGGSRQ